MRFKKLLAGMTAAAMLANLGTASFAESGTSVSDAYAKPMLSAAVDDGYLVQLSDTNTEYEVTIDSVQFQSAKSAPDARTSEKALFEGSSDLIIDPALADTEGYESPHVECGRVDAQPGDIIRVEFAEIGENVGWLDLHDRSWNSICGNSFNVFGGLTETEFTLNAADAQAIRENGLIIGGDNITIKKVVLCSGTERADIKDPLAKLEYYEDGNRDEYWLNVARYGIDPDVYDSATINISGSGELEAFYYTDGENKNPVDLNIKEVNSLTVQNFPDNFCIAPNSGKIYIESVVFGSGDNEIVIDSGFFDGYEAYADLSTPDYPLDWSVNAFLTTKDLKAAGAKAGDVLKFTAEPVTITPDDGDSYTSCCLSAAPVGKYVSADGIDGYTYWVLTQEMIDKGIVLSGECKITGISLCAKSGETRNPVTETVQKVFVSDPVPFIVENTWQDEEGNNCEDFTTLMFGASEIYNAGDVLRLNYKIDKQDDCFMQIVTSDYEKLNNDLSDKEGIVDIWSGIGCIDITLTAEDVAKIEKMGFRIFGKGFTLHRAELVSETEVGRTSLLAEVQGHEYIINDPLSFLPENSQVAYVVADVYGCDGFGDISYWLPTDDWVQGHPGEGGALQVGIDTWRFDFTNETPLVAGSQIFIQKYNDYPIYVHEVRFYDESETLLFTLNAENADVNVVPFTTLNDGDEFWVNPGYFLGEKYEQLDKMVIRTNGSNFVTAGYTASSGEYTEITATSTTLEISKSQLFEDMGVKLFAANGEVNVISVTYYDENGEVLRVLDYTNVNENFIPATPFITLAKGESYVVCPIALLTEDEFAAFDTIVVETTGDGSSGGAISWTQWSDSKNGYDWTCTDNFNSGDEWRAQPVIDNTHPCVSINCWWDEVESEDVIGDSRVGIAAIRLEDADGNELFRIDADHMPKTLGTIERQGQYTLNTEKILENLGSDLAPTDIGKAVIRTIGNGGVNLTRLQLNESGEKWTDSGWTNAGGVLTVDVDLNAGNYLMFVQNWAGDADFELYNVSLYDKNGNLIVTLDATNAYLNSELAPIFDGTTVPDEDIWESVYIYPESILGDKISEVATIEIEAYGDDGSSLRSYNGGDNSDRHIDCTGWISYPITLEEGRSVLQLFADNGRLMVMTVVFKDAEGNVLAELNSENFKQLNVYSSSDKVLAELCRDNGMFVVNSKQLLGDNFSKLNHITVKANGYKDFGIGWNDDHNNWVQSGFTLSEDADYFPKDGTIYTTGGMPSEAHSSICIMNWNGYQSIESVTFYDAAGNVLFELTPDNADLNTQVDGTDYVQFNFDEFELSAEKDNGSIWFDPVTVVEGCIILVAAMIPADVSDDAPATLYFVAGEDEDGNNNCIAEFTIGSEDNTGEEHMCRFSAMLDQAKVEGITNNGLVIAGDNLKVSYIVVGKVDTPNLKAKPGDGKAILTWDKVSGADGYYIYQYDGEYSTHSVDYTTDTNYTVEGLKNGTEYRFSIEAVKKDLRSMWGYEDSVSVTPSAVISEVKGHSLLLGDDIGVKFYMSFADSILADKTAEIRFTVNGRETVVPVSNAVLTSNGYAFTCSVAAAEMNDVITGQLYVGGEALGSEFTYSVKTYADYILNNAETYAGVVPLVNSMLNYGAAAEKYFRGSTGMSFVKPNVTSADLAAYKFTVSDSDSTIDYEGQVISLKSKVTAKLYFSGKTFEVSDFTVLQNGVAVDVSRLTIGTDSNGTYLAISGIGADEMNDPFDITVGNVTVSNYSVFSYVSDAVDSTTEDLADVVAALYDYGCAAAEYLTD